MQLLKGDIEKYQQLCRSLLNQEVDSEAAAFELRDVVELMQMTFMPMTVEELKQIQKRRVALGLTTTKGEELEPIKGSNP